jgi:two-component system OmpR family response regulator
VYVRLLVVEDEPRVSRVLRQGLEEDGHAVDVTAYGEEAIWFATENAYSVIILDIMLPDIDGFEVCARLRAHKCWTPILMLTALEDVHNRAKGLDGGADDYLAKPFSFVELGARLRALARRGENPRPAVLSVGSLRLDPAARRAWRGSAELALTTRELRLLELFMSHPGEMLSRSRILEEIWDFAFDGGSNVVDQLVARLRRKVDHPFGTSDIETIRGAGYRLRIE